MTLTKLRQNLYSDLFRVTGSYGFPVLVKQILLGETYKYNFWMRLCAYLHTKRILKLLFFLPSFIMLRHYRYKFGISIPHQTKIGYGFFIGHCGCIVVNAQCQIGRNCNISQGVTIGQANRGHNMGTAVIGDNVYIVPGAKIVGKVRIGNNVAIGANCVVTKDIPDNSVVVGIPGKAISCNGAYGYINNTEYYETLCLDE